MLKSKLDIFQLAAVIGITAGMSGNTQTKLKHPLRTVVRRDPQSKTTSDYLAYKHMMITSRREEIAEYNRQIEHMKEMKKQSAARKKLESAGGL